MMDHGMCGMMINGRTVVAHKNMNTLRILCVRYRSKGVDTERIGLSSFICSLVSKSLV